MTPQEYQKRQTRAEKETFIIARTEEGFRVHSPVNGGHVYYVTGTPEEPACTCPDFQHHASDSDWRCKHILAVLARHGDAQEPEPQARVTREEPMSGMTLKRSVSPDGKIDALSVECSLPAIGKTVEQIRAQAVQALELQDRIARGFLQKNGTPQRAARQDSPNSAQPATMLEIGGTDGRYGRRLFLSFRVNGRRLRLYGSEKQLAEAISRAGFADYSEDLEEGMRLDLPCRIVSKPTEDGRYLNIEQVLPARAAGERGAKPW